MKLLIVTLLSGTSAWAFMPRFRGIPRSSIVKLEAVGIFFGTSTGNTEDVADLLAAEFGDDAEGPFDVDTLEGSVQDNFGKYDALIVGTPTWNTGADSERSGTGWDELYYGPMQEFKLDGKKVAVFGLGDQISYAENYADATGELHDVFQGLGCQMMGYTSQEGYEHEDSKSIRGDKFCGLLCDNVNQEELSEERVKNWVAQLRAEGFLDGSGAAPAAASAPTAVEPVVTDSFSELEQNSDLLNQAIEVPANSGFKPHYNLQTKSTMWVSADGRSCYYTSDTMSP